MKRRAAPLQLRYDGISRSKQGVSGATNVQRDSAASSH